MSRFLIFIALLYSVVQPVAAEDSVWFKRPVSKFWTVHGATEGTFHYCEITTRLDAPDSYFSFVVDLLKKEFMVLVRYERWHFNADTDSVLRLRIDGLPGGRQVSLNLRYNSYSKRSIVLRHMNFEKFMPLVMDGDYLTLAMDSYRQDLRLNLTGTKAGAYALEDCVAKSRQLFGDPPKVPGVSSPTPAPTPTPSSPQTFQERGA